MWGMHLVLYQSSGSHLLHVLYPHSWPVLNRRYLCGCRATWHADAGLFEEAEQLGLTAELQAAKEALQDRQHAVVAALEAAAARADAGAFASALSTAWLVHRSPSFSNKPQ